MNERPDFYTPTGKPSKVRHGNTSAYVNYNCRCEKCTGALRESMEGYRRRNGAQPLAEHVHGTRLMYAADGCRCSPCKIAMNIYVNEGIARRKANAERAAQSVSAL